MIRWPASGYWTERFPQLRGRESLALSALASTNAPTDNALMFVSHVTEEIRDQLMQHHGCLLLVPEAQRAECGLLEEKHGILYSHDPRYQFAEALIGLWDARSLRGTLAWDSERELVVGENVSIHPSAVVEPCVTIAGDCVIDAGAYVMGGARIGPRVRIGQESVVRENAVVGGYGFGFALAQGKPRIRMPHVGGVLVGADVEVGALTTVCSGTIDPTVIEDGAKIDDHVHIAHNCRICADAFVIACAEVSGSVSVGARSWLAPNCSVRDGVTVGSDCLIGLGAVVTKSVPDGSTAYGNPARVVKT